MASQLALPLATEPALGREDFIVGPANAEAVAFIDAWPDWPMPVAVLHGPAGSGKTHLACVWRARAAAEMISADELSNASIDRSKPLVIENVDSSAATPSRDAALFALLEGASRENPVLLTGHEPPAMWPVTLPDLSSRFSAALSFPLWAPDEALLSALAQKLFTDRQLNVPDSVIQRMILSLERSPAALREFVALADSKALAEGRAVTLALVRELLAARAS